MTSVTRRSTLGLFCSGLFLGCAGKQSAATLPAPVVLPPARQIPVDLDVVVRLDLGRIRRKLGTEPGEALARMLVAPARKPEHLLALALTHSDHVWVGFRPDLDPRHWDNVVILEGDFSTIPSEEITRAFGPSRDLGGGYKRYDRLEETARVAPALLYQLHEERLLFASEAEVDALERTIEMGRAERDATPPARGLASIAARLSRVSEITEGKTPLRALEKARHFDASFDLLDDQIKASFRIHFDAEEDATLARRAISVLAGVALPRDVEVRAESSGDALSVEISAPVRLLLSAIG